MVLPSMAILSWFKTKDIYIINLIGWSWDTTVWGQEIEQFLIESLYIETVNRGQYDNGEYLKLGDYMNR